MVRPPRGAPTPVIEQAPRNGDGRRVRDDFSFPALDHAQIGALKRRAAKLGRDAGKNDLLRAGIAALAALSERQLLDALRAGEPSTPGAEASARTRDKQPSS